MASYVVMEPGGGGTDDAVLVRDGFSFLAFVVPPIWLLWHRLWIEAALAFAIGIGLTALGEVAGFGSTGAALSLLVSLFVGLEGSALRVNALRRRGWREWGVVDADNSAEAEIRYIDAGPPHEPAVAAAAPAAGPIRLRAKESGPALGLFHYPERP